MQFKAPLNGNTGGLKGQVCSLSYELAAIWRWQTFVKMTQSELSHMAGAVDDSTINIVLGISTSIIKWVMHLIC